MRNRTSLPAALVALGLLAPAAARPQQQQPPRPLQPATTAQQSAAQDADDVVRITSNLVQVDVIATDKEGRQVTDLRPEEFKIFQGGKEQQLTNFSYVSTEDAPAEGAAAAAPSAASSVSRDRKNLPPAPSAPPRREQVRRSVALVVDDLAMSFGSVARVKDALRKYVDEQMRPGDLVGIYSTRGGSGSLQQFTTSKAQLHKAVDSLRWLPAPLGGGGVDIFEPIRDDRMLKADPNAPVTNFESAEAKEARERNEDRNRDLIAYGTLGTIRYVLHGMRVAPGRRSVVLFGDNLALHTRKGETLRARDELERVVYRANRAGVVVYAIDARGLVDATFITAEDNPQPDVERTLTARTDRIGEYRRSQDGLYSLAHSTGGLFLHSANKLDTLMRKVVQDQGGYYLLGYRPSEDTFRKKGGDLEIGVRVTRPGVRVRTRSGFAAVTDEEARRDERGTDSELYSLLASPVAGGDVYVRLTANFVENPGGGGAAARMLLHIDGRSLTFADEPDGRKKLVLDVAAVTLGKDGKIIDEFTRTHTVRVGGEAVRVVRENGLTYAADVPVKKPGAYQLRIAVRDVASQRLGSAGQLIEVPDLAKKSLALSGITLREAGPGASSASSSQAAPVTAQTALAPVLAPADPAVRRFSPGQTFSYGYQIYNAAPDPSTRRPRLTLQLRLFHNGQLVDQSQAAPLDTAAQGDPARLRVESFFPVPRNAKPGEYVLQVVVTDESVKDKDRRQASQWIDFEVVN